MKLRPTAQRHTGSRWRGRPPASMQGPDAPGPSKPEPQPVINADVRAQRKPGPLDAETRKKAACVYAAKQRERSELRVAGALSHAQPPPSPPVVVHDVPTVDDLLSAPRFGLNARELILQAAAQVASEQPAPPPHPKPVLRNAAGAGKNAYHDMQAKLAGGGAGAAKAPCMDTTALAASIPPAARPIVPYNPKSSIPRLQRQACCDALFGQYLAALLGICCPDVGQHEGKAIYALRTADALKAAAHAAAAAHEAAVYKAVFNRREYSAAAGRAAVTRELLVQHAGPALAPCLARYNLTETDVLGQQQDGGAGRGESGAGAAEAGDEDLFGDDSEGESEEGDAGAVNALEAPGSEELAAQAEVNTAEHKNEQSTQPQGAPVVAIPDHSAPPCERWLDELFEGSPRAEQPGSGGTDGAVGTDTPAPAAAAAEPPPEQGGQSSAGMTASGPAASPRGGQDGGEALEVEAQHAKRARVEAGTAERLRQPAGHPGVADQVAEFVRGVLDPLYRAQVLDKQHYKDIVRKAVAKVMAHHQHDTSAAFLLREHEAVRKFTLRLVEAAGSATSARAPATVARRPAVNG